MVGWEHLVALKTTTKGTVPFVVVSLTQKQETRSCTRQNRVSLAMLALLRQ